MPRCLDAATNKFHLAATLTRVQRHILDRSHCTTKRFACGINEFNQHNWRDGGLRRTRTSWAVV